MNTNSAALQRLFLSDTRISRTLLTRRAEDLEPVVDPWTGGPLTFLANLGFENAFDLATLNLDVPSGLILSGKHVLGLGFR